MKNIDISKPLRFKNLLDKRKISVLKKNLRAREVSPGITPVFIVLAEGIYFDDVIFLSSEGKDCYDLNVIVENIPTQHERLIDNVSFTDIQNHGKKFVVLNYCLSKELNIGDEITLSNNCNHVVKERIKFKERIDNTLIIGF